MRVQPVIDLGGGSPISEEMPPRVAAAFASPGHARYAVRFLHALDADIAWVVRAEGELTIVEVTVRHGDPERVRTLLRGSYGIEVDPAR